MKKNDWTMSQPYESVWIEANREGYAIRPVAYAEAKLSGGEYPALFRVRVPYLVEYVARMSRKPHLDPYTYVFDEERQEWAVKEGNLYRPAPLGMQRPWVRRFGFVYEPGPEDFFGPLARNKEMQREVEREHGEVFLYTQVDFFIYLCDAPEDLFAIIA